MRAGEVAPDGRLAQPRAGRAVHKATSICGGGTAFGWQSVTMFVSSSRGLCLRRWVMVWHSSNPGTGWSVQGEDQQQEEDI